MRECKLSSSAFSNRFYSLYAPFVTSQSLQASFRSRRRTIRLSDMSPLVRTLGRRMPGRTRDAHSLRDPRPRAARPVVLSLLRDGRASTGLRDPAARSAKRED
jgi:hypothetical protein